MPVYVDDMQMEAQVGRLKARWSHLTADTTEELHAFAARLGLRRAWFQPAKVWAQGPRAGQPRGRDHYDVTDAKRTLAIRLGAIPVSWGDEPWREKRRSERNG